MDATNPSAVTEEELARARELDAAKNMDWGQVIANGGPPCFALMKEGRFCGRAERWQGHGSAHHEFVSLEELLRVYARQEREAEREKLAQWMIRNSFATGHGDDIESLLVELKWQIAERGVQEREAERERIAPQSQWKTLPDEQAWWWYWTGSDYAVPHICSVMVSKTGAKDRYFVADGNLAPWCDEMEGFWLKIDYPNVPTRAEQK